MGERLTNGFAKAGQFPRRKGSTDLEVPTPQQVQWKPRLRKAAGTLCAMVATAVGNWITKNAKWKSGGGYYLKRKIIYY